MNPSLWLQVLDSQALTIPNPVAVFKFSAYILAQGHAMLGFVALSGRHRPYW